MLTHDRLKELLDYNPRTGIFLWKTRRVGPCAVGTEAGSLNPNGYTYICVDRKKYSAHRLAYFYMTGEWPPSIMDHINRNKSDNRWINLRPVSQASNLLNKTEYKNNSSGVKGVSWNKGTKRWDAYIGNGGRLNKGSFLKFEEAVKARKLWEAELTKNSFSA